MSIARPLVYAALHLNSHAIAQWLLQAGADANPSLRRSEADEEDHNPQTLLMAIFNRRLDRSGSSGYQYRGTRVRVEATSGLWRRSSSYSSDTALA